MGEDRGRRQQEEAAAAAAAEANRARETSITRAEAPDPLEERRRSFLTKILDWREGKSGPMNVRDFPDPVGMALYDDAVTSREEGRVGKGYGTLSDGANPTFSAALDKELSMERESQAKGNLENYITGAVTGAEAETGNWANVGNARNMGIAGMRSSAAEGASNRYNQILMKPKEPSFGRQLLGGLIGGLSYAKGGLTV